MRKEDQPSLIFVAATWTSPWTSLRRKSRSGKKDEAGSRGGKAGNRYHRLTRRGRVPGADELQGDTLQTLERLALTERELQICMRT